MTLSPAKNSKNPNQIDEAVQQLSGDSEKLFESAIASNLELSPEERLEAHENALQLVEELKETGSALRAAKSQKPA